MLIVALFFIMVNKVALSQGLSWQVGLAIGSGHSYKIPNGYTADDYRNYGTMSQIGTEVSQNFERLKLIKERLEKNEQTDYCVKVIGVCLMVIMTLGALLLRIKAIKNAVTERSQHGGSVVMCHSQMTGF